VLALGAQDLGLCHPGHGEQPEIARLLRTGERTPQCARRG
jgi:hypothetical protein